MAQDLSVRENVDEWEVELSAEERANYKLIRAELHLMLRQKRRQRALLNRDGMSGSALAVGGRASNQNPPRRLARSPDVPQVCGLLNFGMVLLQLVCWSAWTLKLTCLMFKF